MQFKPEMIYRYDGTFDGFFTAVFEAYARRLPVAGIHGDEIIQTGFGQEIAFVKTDEEKARRVEKGILEKAGGVALRTVQVVFWSGEPDKDTALYRYIRAGLSMGRRVYNDLTHPDILAVDNLECNIGREVQHLKGFVRFAKMENGVYYSRISPRNSLVPLLMPHFADRFADMPFVVHDTAHNLAGVYGGGDWYLVEPGDLPSPELSEDEHALRRMWRAFYDAIAVRERVSHKRQRGMLPLFYRENMAEFTARYAKGFRDSAGSPREPGSGVRKPDSPAPARDSDGAMPTLLEEFAGYSGRGMHKYTIIEAELE